MGALCLGRYVCTRAKAKMHFTDLDLVLSAIIFSRLLLLVAVIPAIWSRNIERRHDAMEVLRILLSRRAGIPLKYSGKQPENPSRASAAETPIAGPAWPRRWLHINR
jgi:hypothetical protein